MTDQLILRNRVQSGSELVGIFARQLDLVAQSVIGPGEKIIGGRQDKDTFLQDPVPQHATLPAAREITVTDIPDIKGDAAASDIHMVSNLAAAIVDRVADISEELTG